MGRFMAEDIIQGNAAIPKTLNCYGYCLNNPKKFIDPSGRKEERDTRSIYDLFLSDGMDIQGLEIGMHYLFGGGESLNKIYGIWGEYMMNDPVLTGKVGDIVMPIGEELSEGESINIVMKIPMIIENGEGIIGYQYLHGTDENAGHFNIFGTISKNNEGDMIFDLVYIWNDIMNPNLDYDTDAIKAEIAKEIPFANPASYEMHILWSDETIIRKNESDKNEGWLKDWNANWMPQDYMYYPWLLDWQDDLYKIKQQYSIFYSNVCSD